MKIKQEVTVTLTTSASTEDVFSALALLNPEDLSLNTVPVPNGKVKKRPKDVRKKYAFGRPKHMTDERVVWNELENRIDVAASCTNIGLTPSELWSKTAKRGTVEHTIKSAIGRNPGAWDLT